MENSIDHIITRILSGNSSSEDFLSLSEWLNADEKNKKEFRLLKSYWDAEVSFSHSLMPNVSLDNLRKKIDDQSRQKRLRLIRFIATPIAAAIAFLVLFFATIHLNTREAKVQQFYTYITDKNKSHFTLDDGTKIILNRNSRFTYSDAYGTDQRKVNLEGEAYFEVAPDKNRPFYVETEEVKIRVLGTVFDVNTHYTRGVRTVLVEGAVALEWGDQKEIRMKPGELADFDRTTTEVTLKEVDVTSYISWKEGYFVFEDEPLEEIMHTLSLWYDKEFLFVGKRSRTLHFSGHIKRYERIETILSAITDVTGVEFRMNGQIILIR